ncbi:MAG: fatty acid--CoA ligase family protein, partial [Bacteroidales bacterium]|nr:fatty acid--CoA ligase family protein [Bacteroidales bacterium]
MMQLFEKFKKYPSRVAFIDRDTTYLYQNLLDEIHRLHLEVENILPPGASVVVNARYSFSSIALFFALALNKNIIQIVTDTNPELVNKNAGLSYASRILAFDKNHNLIVTEVSVKNESHKLLDALKDEGKAGLVLTTSGSTGKPKVILHDLEFLIDSYAHSKVKDNRIISLLGFDHIGGMDILLRALWNSACLVLSPNYQPDIIAKYIEKHAVDVLPASPSFFRAFLMSGVKDRYDLSSLRIMGFGSEPMPESTLNQLRKAFPEVTFQQKYGTSETNAISIKGKNQNELAFKFNSQKSEYKIADGELWLKTPGHIKGYLTSGHNELIKNGWFRTGDLVETDENGYLRINGRTHDVINVGGEKVLPVEVEDVIMNVEGVENCRVYGADSMITGQIV